MGLYSSGDLQIVLPVRNNVAAHRWGVEGAWQTVHATGQIQAVIVECTLAEGITYHSLPLTCLARFTQSTDNQCLSLKLSFGRVLRCHCLAPVICCMYWEPEIISTWQGHVEMSHQRSYYCCATGLSYPRHHLNHDASFRHCPHQPSLYCHLVCLHLCSLYATLPHIHVSSVLHSSAMPQSHASDYSTHHTRNL